MSERPGHREGSLSENLFEAPRELPGAAPAPEGSDAHTLRSAYLRHEGALRSVGSLLLVGGVFVCINGLISAVLLLSALFTAPPDDAVVVILIVLFMCGISGGAALAAAVIATMGLRLYRLEVGSRAWYYGIALFILFFFPVGSVIGSYLLWLLHCDAGKRVLSEPYAAAIEATPYLRAPRPLWVSLLAIGLGLGAGMFALLMVLIVIAMEA